MNKFVLWFFKITGYLPQLFYFKRQEFNRINKKIKGRCIVISNHIRLLDFGNLVFSLFNKTCYALGADVLFKKKATAWFLKSIGVIRLSRENYDFSFIEKSIKVLLKEKVLIVFPEAHLSKDKLDDFKSSFVKIALLTNSPILPTYTNGVYGKKGNKLIYGEKIYPNELYDNNLSENENISNITNICRNKILALKEELENYEK